jgi:hypothetical protein
MQRPKALIACETSGVFREAFLDAGWDAWSCDVLPADTETNRHIRCDVREILDDGWDLMAVMHPPCTRLCRAGHRWLFGPGRSHPKKLPKGRSWVDMLAEYEEAKALFLACWRAPIPCRAVENPVMHAPAREDMPELPEPSRVQPWWFGHEAFKETCWFLDGLPPLQATDRLTPPERGSEAWKRWSAIHRAPPGKDRWKIRSKSWPGMAKAAAAQWGAAALKGRNAHGAAAGA